MNARRFAIALLAVVVWCGTTARAASVDDLARAQAEYDRGVELKATKPAEARVAFAESAALLQHVVDAGADNASIRFNLGNAYLQSGDIGRGIANYLRARQFAPYDPAIQANLATARTYVLTKIGGDAVNDGSRIGWWRFVGEGTRLWLSLGMWLLFWTLVAVPLVRPSKPSTAGAMRGRWMRTVRAASLLIAFLSGSTVVIDRWLASTRTLGVIIASDVVVRKGNGEGFEAQVAEKLAPGVECMVLESRPGWTRIRLPDGTEGWVTDGQLVRVG
ncbi:MAG: hypothetical protein JNL80_16245 [Phycisphaerae bacterium]|nr:hypothetical protein [Phycisphaerae bacterium]